MFSEQWLQEKKAQCIDKMSLVLGQIYAIGSIEDQDDFAYGEAFKEYISITGKVPQATEILDRVFIMCDGVVDGQKIESLNDIEVHILICRNPRVVLKGFL